MLNQRAICLDQEGLGRVNPILPRHSRLSFAGIGPGAEEISQEILSQAAAAERLQIVMILLSPGGSIKRDANL